MASQFSNIVMLFWLPSIFVYNVLGEILLCYRCTWTTKKHVHCTSLKKQKQQRMNADTSISEEVKVHLAVCHRWSYMYSYHIKQAKKLQRYWQNLFGWALVLHHVLFCLFCLSSCFSLFSSIHILFHFPNFARPASRKNEL